MIPYKIKIESSFNNQVSKGYEGMAFTIQGIYYSSNTPESKVNVFDKDGDPITHPIPGQLESKLVTVNPITVKLPILVTDDTVGNRISIFGYLQKSVV